MWLAVTILESKGINLLKMIDQEYVFFFFFKLCKPRKRNTGEKMITDLADLIKLNTKPVVWKTRKRRPIPSNSVFPNIR